MWIKYTNNSKVLTSNIPNGVAVNDATAAMGIAPGAWSEITDEEAAELQQPSPEEQQAAMLAAFTNAIQAHLDAFARTRNYDGILSAATYATSTVPRFHAEGQYAVEARDATWAMAYSILAEVQSGARPMPSMDEVIAELPALAWPEE